MATDAEIRSQTLTSLLNRRAELLANWQPKYGIGSISLDPDYQGLQALIKAVTEEIGATTIINEVTVGRG